MKNKILCHCEERSDEAIPQNQLISGDCHAPLRGLPPKKPADRRNDIHRIVPLLLAMTILFASSTSHAFRRLPYSANPSQLCTMCERVAGDVPTMTVRVSLSTDFMFDAVYEAAHTWNVEGNAMFTFGVTGEANISVADDNMNAVIMGNYAGLCQDDILGLSIPQPPYPIVNSPGTDPEGPKFVEIVERDLVICEGQDWFVGDEDDIGWWDYDLVSVLMHELGHHLGLGHSNCNGNSPDTDCTFEDDTGAVMDTAVLSWWWGDTRRHLLDQSSGGFIAQGDIQGVQHIYGLFDPDLDGDGIINEEDNCVKSSNADQLNSDGDFKGDACDDDNDNDGILNEQDTCPLYFSLEQTDTDSDGTGNLCDDDDDGDGVDDAIDNCPLDENASQFDGDSDGLGNECDPHTMTQEELDLMTNIYKMGKNPYPMLTHDQICQLFLAAKGYWPEGCK